MFRNVKCDLIFETIIRFINYSNPVQFLTTQVLPVINYLKDIYTITVKIIIYNATLISHATRVYM